MMPRALIYGVHGSSLEALRRTGFSFSVVLRFAPIHVCIMTYCALHSRVFPVSPPGISPYATPSLYSAIATFYVVLIEYVKIISGKISLPDLLDLLPIHVPPGKFLINRNFTWSVEVHVLGKFSWSTTQIIRTVQCTCKDG